MKVSLRGTLYVVPPNEPCSCSGSDKAHVEAGRGQASTLTSSVLALPPVLFAAAKSRSLQEGARLRAGEGWWHAGTMSSVSPCGVRCPCPARGWWEPSRASPKPCSQTPWDASCPFPAWCHAGMCHSFGKNAGKQNFSLWFTSQRLQNQLVG